MKVAICRCALRDDTQHAPNPASLTAQGTRLPLQAGGVPLTTPRKDWPLPLLKQILTESVQETPSHLLARELWCGCGSASEWWAYQAGYTSSTAAMSMVCHTETQD